MLSFHAQLKVFVATVPCDLRMNFNGLWTRRIVQTMILEKMGVELCLTSVSKLLASRTDTFFPRLSDKQRPPFFLCKFNGNGLSHAAR